jgi:tetratricopeptide (TPR) repeat protein
MKTKTTMCFAILIIFAFTPLSAQTKAVSEEGQITNPVAANNNTLQEQRSSEVFISFEESATQDSEFQGISTFAFNLLRLRLISTSSPAIVHQGGQDRSCTTIRQGMESPSQLGVKKEQAVLRYYLSGTIEMLGRRASGTSTMGIHYKLNKCTDTGDFLLIPSQDVTFTSDRLLDQLNWISSYILHQIQNEIQRQRVSVHECTLDDDSVTDQALPGIVHDIKTRIDNALNASNEFQASYDDRGATILYCILTPKLHRRVTKALSLGALDETLEAKISIKTTDQSKPYEDPVSTIIKWADRKSETALNNYAEGVATKAVGALQFVRGTERLGIENPLETWEANNYLEQGKKLLTLTNASKQDLKSALEALLRAKRLDGNDPMILRYLAQAQLGNLLYTDARETLEDAQNKLKSPQKKSLLEAEINVLMGDALLNLNATIEAADHYRKALETYNSLTDGGDAAPAVYQKYARALIQSNQRIKATTELLRALPQFPQPAELHRQALTLIRQLSAEELNSVYKDSSENYCKQPESIRDECALLAVEKAEIETNVRHNDSEIRLYANAALQFNPLGRQIHAEALGYAAIAELNTDPDKAGQILNEAESLSNSGFQPNVKVWLRGLRSEYWLQKEDFEKANQAAKLALAEDPENRSSWLMKAEVDVRWAESMKADSTLASRRVALLNDALSKLDLLVSERYTDADELLALANHASQRDSDSRDRFTKILDQNPRDDSALENLLTVCIDWLSDFDCSLNAARKAADTGFRTKTLEIQLDLVEAAMLKEENVDAEEWLKIVGERSELPMDLKTVRDFYTVWLALREKNTEKAKSSFSSWADSVKLLREQGKQRKSIDWSFVGAKTFLRKSQGAEVNLYLKMIQSMEDPSTAIPSFLTRAE